LGQLSGQQLLVPGTSCDQQASGGRHVSGTAQWRCPHQSILRRARKVRTSSLPDLNRVVARPDACEPGLRSARPSGRAAQCRAVLSPGTRDRDIRP
jgi:hypothetical protein